MKNLLTIAGSDSGGGAGIQADLKTFCALGVYGMTVITAVTAQNTTGVTMVTELGREMVKAQIDAVFSDIPVDGVKVGMVSNIEIIEEIADSLLKWGAKNIVIDPVMVSKSGHHLLRQEAKEVLIKRLFPIADIVTPNLFEAEVILGREIKTIEEMEKVAKEIFNFGPKNVLIKGGHLPGEPIDILYDGKNIHRFEGVRLDNKNTHGTGCTLSSAIAAYMAKGFTIEESIKRSKAYLTEAIRQGLKIGKGVGPVNHLWNATGDGS